MRSTPVAGRTHRDETCGGAMRSDRGSCKLWRPTASGQRRSRQCTFQSSSKTCQSRQLRGHNHHGCSGKQPSSKLGREFDSSGPCVVTCTTEVAQAVERSHTLQWRSTMRVSSFVTDCFYFEEDTLEELLFDEVVGGVNRELNLIKSFPVYQAVPRAELTGKVWSTRWCYRRKGPNTSESAFRGETVRKFSGRKLGSRPRECCWRWPCRKTSPFCSVTFVLHS